MSGQHLLPGEGERGLASYAVDDLRGLVLGAWDDFLDLAAGADLAAPTRLTAWDAHDLCVHLGSWPEARALQRMLGEAKRGAETEDPFDRADRTDWPDDTDRSRHSDRSRGDARFDQEAHNAAIVAAHRPAGRDEVLESLATSRRETAAFFDSPAAVELATRPVRSVLGPLPLMSIVVAGCYELAVHALDLAPAGARAPGRDLLDAGLGALTDVTGALAARSEIDTTFASLTPEGRWVVGVAGQSWTTMSLPEVPQDWPAVEGTAAVLLDVSAGRRSAPVLLARRELRLHHVPELMGLASIVAEVPGLPGGATLQGAVRHVAGVGRWVRRLPGLPGLPGR